MLRSMAKVFAYSKAPKTTFAILHPREALRIRAMKKWLRKTAPAGRTAALGAAALAVPVGIVLALKAASRPHDLD
jgi:hypothetical protein